MDTVLRNQFLRTVLALCRLAVRADAEDIREDVAGECEDALEVWSESAPDVRLQQVRRWTDSVTAILNRLEGQSGLDRVALVRAQTMVLRLQAKLPQPTVAVQRVAEPAPTRTPTNLSENKTKVLEAVSASPEVRTRDLVEQFKGAMSSRTVKRVLGELVSDGLIARTEHGDHSISYRAS